MKTTRLNGEAGQNFLPVLILLGLLAAARAEGPRDAGPDSVDSLLEEDSREKQAWWEQDLLGPYKAWKQDFAERSGFSW